MLFFCPKNRHPHRISFMTKAPKTPNCQILSEIRSRNFPEVQPQVLYPHPSVAFPTCPSAVRDPFLIASLGLTGSGRPDPKRKKEVEKSIRTEANLQPNRSLDPTAAAPLTSSPLAARRDEKGRSETRRLVTEGFTRLRFDELYIYIYNIKYFHNHKKIALLQ